MDAAQDAARTVETLEHMLRKVPALRAATVKPFPSFYTVASLDGETRAHLQQSILQAVDEDNKRSPVEASCVMCIGHNKGWEQAASDFSREDVRLETSNAALLAGAGADWAEAFDDGCWSLVDLVTPTWG